MILRAINIEDFEIRKAGDRVIEFIISTERKDSHGTIIKMDGWDISDYNKSGAFYYQHLTGGFDDPNPDNALGTGRAQKEGNQLIGIANFEPENLNPLAEKILGKVDFGTLKSTSVGFMPTKGNWGDTNRNEDPEIYYFTGQILKEFSIVHIPSNPDAIKKSMEVFDFYMTKKLDEHKSEGFKKDYRFNLNKLRRQREYLLNLAEKRNFL